MSSKMCPIKLKGSDLIKYRRLRRKYPVSQNFFERNCWNAKRFMFKGVIRTYACRRKRSHRVCFVQHIHSLPCNKLVKKMIKRRFKNVRQWSGLLVDHYVYAGRIRYYVDQVLDQTTEPQQAVSNSGRASCKLPDKALAQEEKTISKAKHQQNRLVNELRRLNATIIDVAAINADANCLTGTNTSNLHHQLNPRLTNMEKDFRSTLLISNNGMQLINESEGKRRQCAMGQKKYADTKKNRKNRKIVKSSSSEEMATPTASPSTASDTDTGEKKHLFMRLRRLTGCNRWVSFCPTHKEYQCFCRGDPPKEQRDTTLSHSKVATEVDYSSDSQSEASEEAEEEEDQELQVAEEEGDQELKAAEEDEDQELEEAEEEKDQELQAAKEDEDQEVQAAEEEEDQELHSAKEDEQQEVQEKFELEKPFPMPIRGFFCLCQWKYFLAAFESHKIFIWAVQMKTNTFMAVTTCNMTPPVKEGNCAVNIRYAANQDLLPLLAVQMLKRGWQNDNTNNHIIDMEGMPGYWHIKPLKENICLNSRPEISTFILVEKEEKMSPTWTMPEPEDLPADLHYDEIDRSSPPDSQNAPTMDLDGAISFANIRCQFLKEMPQESEEILEQSEANNVDTDELQPEMMPAEALASQPNPSQDETAKVLTTLPEKPVITCVEYLPPLKGLPGIIADASFSVHPPPAKISRLSTNEAVQELPTSTTATSSTSTTNLVDKTNQKEVNIGKKSPNSGTVSPLKYPPTPMVKSIEVERPIKLNLPAQNLKNPGIAVKVADKELHMDQPASSGNTSDRKVFLRVKIVSSNEELQGNVELQTPNTLPAGYTLPAPKKIASSLSTSNCPTTRTPREVRLIYPRPNTEVNGQSMKYQTKSIITPKTVAITKMPSSEEVCPCPSQLVTEETLPLQPNQTGKKVAERPSSQRPRLELATASSVPVFGFICAKGLPAFAARKQDFNFIVQIPEAEAILFRSLAQINIFLNKHLSTNPEFQNRLPAEWKFLLTKY